MSDFFELIRNRKSCRTYIAGSIEPETREKLTSYMNESSSGIFRNELISFQWIERNYTTDIPMKLNYGAITNHSNYILGKAAFNMESYVDYGYLMEKIVLKATEFGLGTCWIGYFDAVYFPEITRKKGEYIPSLIIVGNAAKKQNVSEKITRYLAKANTRKPWNQLFFLDNMSTPLNKESAGKYADVIEMLRLAPSSGNSQPWRMIKENNKDCYHFYRKTVHPLYQKKRLHDVDMGIGLAHFELAADHLGLKGKWISIDGLNKYTNQAIEYVISWEGE